MEESSRLLSILKDRCCVYNVSWLLSWPRWILSMSHAIYSSYILILSSHVGTRSSVASWGTMLQAGRSWVWFPVRSFEYSFGVILPSQDNAVGIATDYGLDGRGVGVRVTVVSRIFSSPRRSDRLWGPPSLLYKGYGELSLTSNWWCPW
jgi:hypothetical protein